LTYIIRECTTILQIVGEGLLRKFGLESLKDLLGRLTLLMTTTKMFKRSHW